MSSLIPMREIRAYIKRLSGILGLGGWRIEVNEREQLEDYYARVRCKRAEDLACIEVMPSARESWADTERILVHEGLHILHWRYSQKFQDVIETYVADATARRELLREEEELEEIFVERVAQILAPHMPRIRRKESQ